MSNSNDCALMLALILKLAEKDGVAPLDELPGAWERSLPFKWSFIINGHQVPVATARKGLFVPACACNVYAAKFLAGSFTFHGEKVKGIIGLAHEFIQILREELYGPAMLSGPAVASGEKAVQHARPPWLPNVWQRLPRRAPGVQHTN